MTEDLEGPLVSALAALQRALDESGGPSMITGGLAVTLLGAPRFTQDIDVTLSGSTADQAALLLVLARHGIVPRAGHSDELARTSQVYLLEHHDSRVPIDLSLAWLPFEEEALRRATVVEIGHVAVRVASPSDLVVYKAVAARPRDLDDIEQLLAIHWDHLDFSRVRQYLAAFDEVLEDQSRLDLFDRIASRVHSAR
jgi:hypothetical protein